MRAYDPSRPIVAIDTETAPFGQGEMAPALTCVSFAWWDGEQYQTALLDHERGVDSVRNWLSDAIAGSYTIAGQNFPYDVAVLSREAPDLLPLFIDAYEAGVIHDTQHGEWLNDTALGLLRTEWDDEKGEYTTKKSYSLDNLARIHLGALPYKSECASCGSPIKKIDKVWTCLGCGTVHESLEEAEEAGLVYTQRKQYGDLRGVPIKHWAEGARKYPMLDAEYTLRVAEHEREIAASIHPHNPLEASLAHVSRTYLALHLISCWGRELDWERARLFERMVREYQATYVPDMKAAGLIVETLRGKNKGKLTEKKAPLQRLVASALCEIGAFKEDTYPFESLEDIVQHPADFFEEDYLTDGGKSGNRQIKLAAAVLKDLALREYQDPTTNKLLKRVAGYKEAKKLHSAFAQPMLIFGAGPTHARYGFAETGRTTCSGGGKKKRSGFNDQQFPRKNPKGLVAYMMEQIGEEIDARSCFKPRDGWVMSSTDYSALEMCTFAQSCLWLVGYSSLADALNNGIDPHSLFAADLLGCSYEEVVERIKAGDPIAKEARQRAKVANFGYPGGMGAKKFLKYAKAQDIVMTLDESKRLRRMYLERWREANDYFDLMSQKAEGENAIFVGLVSNMISGGCRYTDLCNRHFQELAAFGATSALWKIVRECYDERLESPLFGSRITAFIHDEFLAEHPEDRAHEAAERLALVARETMQEIVPDVKIKAEPALMRRWYKGAETVRDDNGRLVPWEPEVKAA